MSSKPRRNEQLLDPREDSKNKSVHQLNSLFFIVGLSLVLLSLYTSRAVLDATPKLKDADIPFIGAEAWKDLKELNDLGPKVTGTRENEVLAVNIIKSRIEKILSKANSKQRAEFDHQIVSGSYFLDFNPGSASVYRSVQNLVVRVEGDSDNRNAVLINCHFDSVYGSYGANDDIANCAIMLELLSILTSQDTRLRHDLIFLFNGAEEVGLRASHGFISKHKWAKDVKVLINLEAAGSGGKEILFQTGPGNSWLLNHYHAVKRPYAQVSSEEIFQSGIIPSDTDFRVFRDFGNVIGLDFAHIAKGYRYHTKYDHIRFLSQNFIQQTGENILALTISLANGFELDNPEKYFSKTDFAVYFDYLGIVFVHYTKEMGVLINVVVAILTVVIGHSSLKKVTADTHTWHIMKQTLRGFFYLSFGIIVSGSVCYLLGYFLDKSGHSMTWYRNTQLALGIYGSATIFCLMFANDVLNMKFDDEESPISLSLKVQARLNGVSLLWSMAALALTVTGFRSGYLFMVILFFTFIANLLNYFMKFQNSVRSWLYVFMASQFFCMLWSTYFLNVLSDVFIPIMGRSGSSKNPDIILSRLVCVCTIFIVSYLIPLTQLFKGKVLQYLVIMSIFFTSIFLATSTHHGFPYQDDSNENPTPQRHHVLHTVRNLYDFEGNLRLSDAGYLFLEWDRNAKKTIEGIVMPEQTQSPWQMCNNEILCGFPIVQSRMLMLGFEWLPTKNKPTVRDEAVIDSHSKFNIGDGLVKFVFTVNSTSLTAIHIRPRAENEMISWSFSGNVSSVANTTFMCSIANGLKEQIEPLKFDVTLKVKSTATNEPLIDVMLVTVQNDEKDFSSDFQKLIKRFPTWTFPVPLLASVTGFTF